MGGVRCARFTCKMSPLGHMSQRCAGSCLIVCVSYNLAIRAIQASTSHSLARIALFVVARLALILEALRIETDVWVVAVDVVQPDSMMNYQTQLLVTYLAQPTIQCYPVIDIGLPCSLPRFALIELFLGQHSPQSFGLYNPALPPRQLLLYRHTKKGPSSWPSPSRYQYITSEYSELFSLCIPRAFLPILTIVLVCGM